MSQPPECESAFSKRFSRVLDSIGVHHLLPDSKALTESLLSVDGCQIVVEGVYIQGLSYLVILLALIQNNHCVLIETK